MAYLWVAFTDRKMNLAMFIHMGAGMLLYPFSLFLPTIIKNMRRLEVLSYECASFFCTTDAGAAVLMITIRYLPARTRQRGLCNTFVTILGVVGFGVLLGSVNVVCAYEVRRMLPRSLGKLVPVHRKHHLLDEQQYRGRLQARDRPWFRYWPGKY
jgi:protein-S-isoprenylcysteine O-methyltransferase Ste14